MLIHAKDEAFKFAPRQVATVAVDGIDVSNRCFAFDAENGYAFCYKVDEKGEFKKEDNNLQPETVRGVITFTLKCDTKDGPCWQKSKANASREPGARKELPLTTPEDVKRATKKLESK